MKNIILITGILFSILSCEIEKLKPEDVINTPPTWDDTPEPIDPYSIEVPCVLSDNVIRFNLQNFNVSSVEINPPFSPTTQFGSNYAVVADLAGSTDIEFYFASAPTTGYYTTNGGVAINSSNKVIVRTLQGGNYYYGNPGGNVYVQCFQDYTVISYCDIDFTAGFTIHDSKGSFTY